MPSRWTVGTPDTGFTSARTGWSKPGMSDALRAEIRRSPPDHPPPSQQTAEDESRISYSPEWQ